ncbi:MAG: NYN domain-containing protein [Pirellulales bacterium]
MSLIIDGYNLLYAAGIVGRGLGPGGLERSRLALLNVLAQSIDPAELPRTTVVFDATGAPPGLPRTLEHRGLTVCFAPKGQDADTVIEELIRKDSAPRSLTVVSSDHRLHNAARRRRAKAIDSDRWYAELLAARRKRAKGPKPPTSAPPGPLNESEVEFWLRKFAGKTDENPEDMDNPFPPGYAEEL